MKPWVDRPLRGLPVVWYGSFSKSQVRMLVVQRGVLLSWGSYAPSQSISACHFTDQTLSIEEGIKVTESPSQVGWLGQSWSPFCLLLSILGTTSVPSTLLCCHAWRNSWPAVGLHPPGIVHSGFCHFSSKDLAMPPQHSQVDRLYLLTASHHFGFIFISTNHNLKDCPIALVMKSLSL